MLMPINNHNGSPQDYSPAPNNITSLISLSLLMAPLGSTLNIITDVSTSIHPCKYYLNMFLLLPSLYLTLYISSPSNNLYASFLSTRKMI